MPVPPTAASMNRILDGAIATSAAVQAEFLSDITIFENAGEDVIAQAVLTGKATRAGDPRQDWQSWIEGAPPLLVALEADQWIIDADPVEDEADFVRRYHCRPHQLRTLVEAFPQKVFLNLRSVNRDPASGAATGMDKYLASGARSIMGPVLEAADPARIYVNAERRVALFDILLGSRGAFDAKVTAIGEKADALAGAYATACERVAGVDSGARSRTGDALSPVQLKYRLAYYACYTAHRPETRDEAVQPMLDGADDLVADPTALVAAVKALNTFHNRFTAPLTGAYGGVYSTRRCEMDAILEASPAAGLADRVRVQDRSMSLVLLDTLTGAYPGGPNERRFPRALCRMASSADLLSDEQWMVLLESVRINEEALKRKAAFMTALREVAAGRRRDLEAPFAAYEGAIEDATRRCAPMLKRAAMSAPEVTIDALKAAVQSASPVGAGLFAGGSLEAGVALIAFGVLAKMVAGALGENLADRFPDGCGCSPAHREVYDFVHDVRVPR